MMRTTLTIDDRTATALKELAHRSGKSYKQVVNEALASGLHDLEHPAPRAYQLQPHSLGAVRAGVDLDKALRVADAWADEASADKLEQRR
jgi:predicted transcriptional regulator